MNRVIRSAALGATAALALALLSRQRLQLCQADAAVKRVAARTGALESCHVSANSQNLTEVMSQAAHVGTLAALDLHRGRCNRSGLEGHQLITINGNFARRPRHYDALSGQLVERLTALLEGRHHRRHLRDHAPKLLQRRLQILHDAVEHDRDVVLAQSLLTRARPPG